MKNFLIAFSLVFFSSLATGVMAIDSSMAPLGLTQGAKVMPATYQVPASNLGQATKVHVSPEVIPGKTTVTYGRANKQDAFGFGSTWIRVMSKLGEVIFSLVMLSIVVMVIRKSWDFAGDKKRR